MQFQPVDLQFPLGGIDVSLAFGQQRASVAPMGATYDRSFQQQKFETTRSGVNVRGFEPGTNRMRGGSRPGLTKYIAAQVNGGNPVQGLGVSVNSNITPPGGVTQSSTSQRVVTLLAVAGGKLRVASAGGSAWVTPTNGNSKLFSATAPVQMTQGLYAGAPAVFFADGTNFYYWTPSNNTLNTWASTSPSSATVSFGAGVGAPRLVCTWRGRIVAAGFKSDPQNWSMSANGQYVSGAASGSGGGENYNFAPTSVAATNAYAGNNSALGKVGDPINGLVPINDNNLVFLGDHTVWIMRDDPGLGGTLTQLEGNVGGCFGQAWCLDSEGTLYWLSNKMGVYQFSQFDYPRRISQRIDPLLTAVNTGTTLPTMVWDDLLQGFHLFLSSTTSGQPATHYFWERRTNAWWQDTFANNYHNPNCCLLFDGNTAADRRALVGCQDGYVRYLDLNATTDDGTAVSSQVVIGPVMSGFTQLMVRELRAVLGTSSGSVTWALYSGTSAEGALSGTPVATGAWGAGLNGVQYVRRNGKAMYLKLTASAPWSYEQVRCNVAALGAVRERNQR